MDNIALLLMFDRAHSIEGWICCESILEQDAKARVYVLCLDDDVYREAERKTCEPIHIQQLENHFPQLKIARTNRQWPGYTQTCKVFLPTFIMDKFGEKRLLYTDSDFLFWDHWQPIEKELNDLSFLATDRELEPPPKHGRYNGGCFACRDDTHSRTFFSWWQDRVIEWCNWEYGPDGRFTEEGYLNIIYDEPDKFSNIGVCKNPGLNLAHWNVKKHNLEQRGKHILIDNKHSLICFHYQSYCFLPDKVEEPHVSQDIIEMVYKPYHQKILATIRRRSG